MKKIALNLNTFMFLDDRGNVLGVFGSHDNVLVYNKPHITGEQLSDMMTASQHISDKPRDIEKFPTDSFGVHFWDHRRGTYSQLHEVKENNEPVKLRDIYVGPKEN
jgi:hypothetical protein